MHRPHAFFIQRFVPVSPTTSIVRYESYRNKNSNDADFELMKSTLKHIMSENNSLLERRQKDLNSTAYFSGEHGLQMNNGPSGLQKMVRDTLVEHLQREERAKKEIWPARQTLPNTASVSEQDLQFCSNLSCHVKSECRSNLAAQPAMNIAW